MKCTKFAPSRKIYRSGLLIVCGGVLALLLRQLISISMETRVPAAPALPAPAEVRRLEGGGAGREESDARKISKLLPSLPMEFWERHRYLIDEMYASNKTCAVFPNIFEFKYNNIYWQTYKTSNITFELYSAFYDTRKLNDLDNSVYILSMIDSVDINVQTYCQLWYENRSIPVIVATIMYKYIWIKDWGDPEPGGFAPFLVVCQLPQGGPPQPPSCVSLVSKPCDRATNMLSVTYDVPSEKEEFAVCVKGLDFLSVDLSSRIVEWLEILFLMGVHKVFFYQLQVHPNIQKVLDYYESLGRVDTTRITLPAEQPNLPILQHQYLVNNLAQQCYNELIPYNDCFYRNLYSYKYIVLLDIDEIIAPAKDSNWSQLMKRVRRKSEPDKFSSYNARNVYFFDDLTPSDLYNNVPPYMHMLRHTHRSKRFTEMYDYVKSFFDTEHVITLHNHMPFESSNYVYLTYSISEEDAQLNHYRKDCAEELDCEPYRNETVQDFVLWRFKNTLVSRVTNVLKTLNLV